MKESDNAHLFKGDISHRFPIIVQLPNLVAQPVGKKGILNILIIGGFWFPPRTCRYDSLSLSVTNMDRVVETPNHVGGQTMDPITLILTALTTGAAASVKDVTSSAIKDAYNELKAFLQHKLAGKPSAEVALHEHETDPITWESPLRKELMQIQVDQDENIIEAAQKVMTLVQPQQAAVGKYNVQITGNVQGLAQGDHQQVTLNFGDEPKGGDVQLQRTDNDNHGKI